MTRRELTLALIALTMVAVSPHVMGSWWGVLTIAVGLGCIMLIAVTTQPPSREERQRRRYRDAPRTSNGRWTWDESWRWTEDRESPFR